MIIKVWKGLTAVTHFLLLPEVSCWLSGLETRATEVREDEPAAGGLGLAARSGSGSIRLRVVREHSSCAVTGMFSTAFRHLALTMFCMPRGQLGAGPLLISLLNHFTSRGTNSWKRASSAPLLCLGLEGKNRGVLKGTERLSEWEQSREKLRTSPDST